MTHPWVMDKCVTITIDLANEKLKHRHTFWLCLHCNLDIKDIPLCMLCLRCDLDLSLEIWSWVNAMTDPSSGWSIVQLQGSIDVTIPTGCEQTTDGHGDSHTPHPLSIINKTWCVCETQMPQQSPNWLFLVKRSRSRSLILVLFERISLVVYTYQILVWSLYLLQFESYGQG